MNWRWNRGVRADTVASIRFLSNVVVLEQECRVATAEAPTILADVEESVGGFGPLKSLLKAISAVYANHEVSPPLSA